MLRFCCLAGQIHPRALVKRSMGGRPLGVRTRRGGRALTAATALALLGPPGRARAADDGVVLNQLDPGTPVDSFFSLPSPWAPGHLSPSGTVGFDYIHRPLVLFGEGGEELGDVVGGQGFIRLSAAFALFDRLLVHAEMPFAVFQEGDSPATAGVRVNSPDSAQVGNLRLGARGVIFGRYRDPFQLGVGTNVLFPTAPSQSYVGDGGFVFRPHLIVGGRTSFLTYSATGGAALRTSDSPHAATFGGGVAWVGLDEMLQIGPEVFGAVNLSDESLIDSDEGARIDRTGRLSMEGLLGVKASFLDGLVAGAAAGPGLTSGPGTPRFRLILNVGYVPPVPLDAGVDSDGDGIFNPDDACPQTPGVPSEIESKNGCPPDDDDDGVTNDVDACPQVAGPRSDDPKTSGCPDGDGDGIIDEVDACPKVPGVASADPSKHGCPSDTDGDGISDVEDACPSVAGVASSNPAKHGCPPDTDGDGITDDVDACPTVKGLPHPDDPSKHGCPQVHVTPVAIVVDQVIPFPFGSYDLSEERAEDLLEEVAAALRKHDEIELVDIQGHTDDVGGAAWNLTLSQLRAAQVRKWLVGAGIEERRLTSQGFGLTKPVATNRTEEGRAQNRRVEFRILRRSNAPGAAPPPATDPPSTDPPAAEGAGEPSPSTE